MLRKLANLCAPILLYIRYRNKLDPFKIVVKLLKIKPILRQTKSTIIIAPVRVSPMSNLLEGLVGYFYKLKGHKVVAVMCDQAVDYCENLSRSDSNKVLSCALCKKEQDRFCDFFGFENVSVKNQLSGHERNEIKTFVDSRSFKKDEDFIFSGVNLKDEIVGGTLRYTLKSYYESDMEILKKYAVTAYIFSKAFRKIQEKQEAKSLFISHGIYSTWGSIIATSKKIGLDFTVWGRGYVGQGSLLFGHSKSYHKDFIEEPNSLWENLVLTAPEIDNVMYYFTEKTKVANKTDYVNYYNNLKRIEFDVDFFWDKIEQFDTRFGMFTNIPWDGQIFNKTETFPDTKSYVKSTIDWFINNPSCCLIIRAHPAEKTGLESNQSETFSMLLSELYPILPANIFFLSPDNPISSYELIRKIDVAILYGSTLSLEFAVMGYPVIQTGSFNISNKEIVYEIKNLDQYYSLLESAKNKRLVMTEEMKERALKYGYYWIYKRHIPDHTVELERLNFRSFKFKNKEEFINNETLNFVYERIENKKLLIN